MGLRPQDLPTSLLKKTLANVQDSRQHKWKGTLDSSKAHHRCHKGGGVELQLQPWMFLLQQATCCESDLRGVGGGTCRCMPIGQSMGWNTSILIHKPFWWQRLWLERLHKRARIKELPVAGCESSTSSHVKPRYPLLKHVCYNEV